MRRSRCAAGTSPRSSWTTSETPPKASGCYSRCALGPCLEGTLREIPHTESDAVFAEPDQPHAYLGDNRLLADLAP